MVLEATMGTFLQCGSETLVRAGTYGCCRLSIRTSFEPPRGKWRTHAQGLLSTTLSRPPLSHIVHPPRPLNGKKRCMAYIVAPADN